jgi:hypothetical protein
MDSEKEEYIRDYDEIYSDRLIDPSIKTLDNDICKSVLEQIKQDILVYIPDDDDSINDLLIKKIQMEEEIYPKLYNFRIYCREYDDIYKDLCERIEIFTISSKEDNKCDENLNSKPRSQKEIDREHRLKFYLKK